jgi:3-methylfumaryl-CoA hydratase
MTSEGVANGVWRPDPEVAVDVVPASAALALHGLLDAPGDPPADGDPVPLLWHWLAFLPRTAQRDLREDGHPRHGAFMPPNAPPRRMFGGARVQMHEPLRVGDPLTRVTHVVSHETKEGRSGSLSLVTLQHDVRGASGGALTEQDDIIYREPAPLAARRSRETADDDEWSWSRDVECDPVMLFRFSALTYNAHRIHYDRPYATDVEGYPGLVVHGPLQAILLADLCVRNRPGAIRSFVFRATAPAFDSQRLRIRGRPAGPDAVELAALTGDGVCSMVATAEYWE